jgi:hypothetical protein
MRKDRTRNDTRIRIAHLAARLMVEDGIEDHGQAKRKAARQAGFPDVRQLPTNDEVDDARREYQALYYRDEQRSRLRELREKALAVMREFSQFNPYLTGSVLTGSAGKYADIDIQLFTDSAKMVELYLLDRRIAYRSAQRRMYGGEDALTIPVFELTRDDIPIRIEVLSSADLRRPLRAHPGGRIIERAKAQAVEALLAEQQS